MNFFERIKECYLIAEIGVNHNGDLLLAKKMTLAAKKAGASAVKFQTFSADALVSLGTPKVKYQESTTKKEETHYEMIKKLELSQKDHILLKEYCDTIGIDFISTPYDIDSAFFLAQIGVEIFKTASADIVDLPLQNWLSKTAKPVIISTGMATLGEIENVIEIYRKAPNENIVLLHCVSNYPSSDESLNLNAMVTLREAFEVPIGFSDHSIGAEAAIISIALGAKVIEKHFTLDKNLPGPDHKASSTPEEFSLLANSIRRAEKMLGSRAKKPQEEEKQMAMVSRKSIFSNSDIKMGEAFTIDNLTLKRPGTGLTSAFLPFFIGRIASRDIKANTMLSFGDIS